jgi:hypothetical protein
MAAGTVAQVVAATRDKLITQCTIGGQTLSGLKMVMLTLTHPATYAAADTFDISAYISTIVGYACPALDDSGAVLAKFVPGTSRSGVGCTVPMYTINTTSGAPQDASTAANAKAVTVTVFGY